MQLISTSHSLKVTLKDEEGKVCLFDNVPIVEVIDQAHQMRWFASGLNSHPINRRNGLLKPEMGLAYDKQSIFINSNGMPTFQFVQRTPHTIEPQEHQWEIPRHPVFAKESQQIPLLGTVAVLTVGLPIYGPNEAQHPHPFGDPYVNKILDFCHGHTAGRGDYHFHFAPTCLLKTPDGNEEHYNIVGFSLDGYPIVAHYLSVLDDDGQPVLDPKGEFQFNWQEVSGYEPMENYRAKVLEGKDPSTYVWENYNFQLNREGRTLDSCNGRVLEKRLLADGATFDERDFFKSDYAYFLTGEFPYILAKYRGEAKAIQNRRTYNRDGEFLELFKNDIDKNGKISSNELSGDRKKLILDYDSDGDGMISKSEARLMAPKNQVYRSRPRVSGRPGRETRRETSRGESRRSLGRTREYTSSSHLSSSRSGGLFFQVFDVNKDGEISRDEINNASKILMKLDVNGDNRISRREISPSLLTSKT